MARVIVFDLDNTLFDTRSLPATLTDPIYESLRNVNHGPGAVSRETLESAFHESWSIPFPVVAARHSLPQRMLDLWRQAHQTMTISVPLVPYPDVLPVLRRIGGFRCLLTSGYRRVQNAKIDALAIRDQFDLILIDAADDPVSLGKQKILADLIQARDWRPSDLLIVGDSPTSELAAGRNLGIPTVQILRPGVQKSEVADRHIVSLTELL